MIWGSIEGGEGLGVRMLPLGAPGFKGPSMLIVYRVCCYEDMWFALPAESGGTQVGMLASCEERLGARTMVVVPLSQYISWVGGREVDAHGRHTLILTSGSGRGSGVIVV
jgi:hypothetical protein